MITTNSGMRFHANIINRLLPILLVLACAAPQGKIAPATSVPSPSPMASPAEGEKELKDIIEEDSGIQGKFDFPVLINDKVEAFITYFQTEQRPIFVKWLARSERYIPMMKKILKEHGLPEDLVYMAMIESGFSPRAYSRRRAVGPWQFITRTGKKYGLRVDWWVDERRDPEKSTVAAALYLQDLYELFGSWHLAAAAFNAGENKIVRAIMKNQTEDFWEMSQSRHLRRETKEYVPKLIAAALIAKDPEKYGFTGIEYEAPVVYETVDVPPSTDLRAVAKACGMDYAEIKALNPALIRWATPPTSSTFTVRIPTGTAEMYARNFPGLEASSKITMVRHRVLRGETLSEIAREYGIGIEPIKQINGIRSSRIIRAGRELVIPLPGLVPDKKIKELAKIQEEKEAKITQERKRAASPLSVSPDGESFLYEVQEGDTLWDIAQKFEVSVYDIRKWNRMGRYRRTIYPGQKIRIFGAVPSRET